MSYYGKGNNGRPILLRKYDVTSAVSEVTFDGVFKGDFDWHYLIGVDVDVSSASVDLRAIRRANGSDVTSTLDVMSHKGTDTDLGPGALTFSWGEPQDGMIHHKSFVPNQGDLLIFPAKLIT